MLDLWDDEDAIERVFLLNNVRFYVRIFADKLQSPGDLLRQLNTFASDINAPENMNGFEDWVLNAMEAVTGALASASPTRNSVPLLNFFSPKTYAFELVNNEGRLCPQQVDYAPGEYLRTTPRVHVVDELPHDERRPRPPAWVFGGRRLAQPQDTILRSDVPRVPYSHFLASELIKVDDDLEDLDLCYPPHTVRHVGTENFFFFKQTFNGDGLRRELDILNQINTMTEPVRTSKLVGLVFWDGEEDVLMGFLLDYVEGSTLAATLHQDGVIWGDARPGNVLINPKGDALIVDFGGGYSPNYVLQGLKRTEEGDLVALKRMAEEMGVPISK